MEFAGTEITQETILATRQHFADLIQSCIDDAKAGKIRVNDLESYLVRQGDSLRAMQAGDSDYTFTFAQRAYWIQTGESVPMLPM